MRVPELCLWRWVGQGEDPQYKGVHWEIYLSLCLERKEDHQNDPNASEKERRFPLCQWGLAWRRCCERGKENPVQYRRASDEVPRRRLEFRSKQKIREHLTEAT